MLLLEEPLAADDHEALIKEARRRTRRRRAGIAASLLAAGAVIFVALGGGAGGGAGGPRASGHGTPAAPGSSRAANRTIAAGALAVLPDIGWFDLLAPGEGLAANGVGLYLTSDDGGRWRTLEVPGLSGGDVIANTTAVASLGHNRLIVAFLGAPQNCTHHPPRSRTATPSYGHLEWSVTRGRSWSAAKLAGCAPVVSISAVSKRVAFAVTGRALLATHDGWRTWVRIGRLPFRGPIEFTSARDGWGLDGRTAGPTAIGNDLRTGALYRTRDGGRSWTRVRLCASHDGGTVQYSCGVPQFFGPAAGILPVGESHGHAFKLVIYTTRDGGARWTPVATPLTRARVRVPKAWAILAERWFAAASPRDWMLAVARRTYVTSDAGRSWQSFVARQPRRFAAVGRQLALASPQDGWQLLGDHLEYTRDGGRRWRLLASQGS